MNRYIMTIATELDGHAGATTAFVNSETIMTRPQALILINQIFGSDSIFEEYASSLERNDPAYYYGDMVSKIDDFEDRTPIAVTVMKLPSKLTKNKVYITDSRTG
jgi:hypothetical protein